MTGTLQKVAFVCLPDHQLELFSALTRHPAYRPEVIVDFNAQSYCFKLAEILQIPTSGDLAALKRFPAEFVVIPDERPDLKVEVTDLLGNPEVSVVTVSEMATLVGLDPDNKGTGRAGYAPAEWSVPIEIQPAEDVPVARPHDVTPAPGPTPAAWPAPAEPVRFEGEADRRTPGAGPMPVREAKPAPEEPAPIIADTAAPLAPATPPFGAPAGGPFTPPEVGLGAVVETLNLAFDKHLLLRRILEIAVSAAGGDSGSIMLLDESGEYLKIAVSNGLSDDVVRRTRQRVGEGVAGNVLLEGRSRVLVDKLNDPRYRSGRERSDIRSAVCVPIKCGNRAIGVLNVSSDRRADAFDDRSMQLMEKLGVEVAGVILRALELSPAAGQTLASTLKTQIDGILSMELPLRGRLEAVADKLARLIEASACRIYLYDGTGKRLELFGEHGQGSLRAGAGTILADRGILGWVAARGKPEALVSIHSEAEKRAVFYFPLIARDRLGMVELENVPVDESSRVEVFDAMAQATGHLAAKIEQERSTRLLARRAEQMLRLSDLAAELIVDQSEEELAELAVHSTVELFGADLAVLRLQPEGTLTLSNPEFGLRGDALSVGLLGFEEDLGACATARNQVLTPLTMPPDFQERLAGLGEVRWAVALPLLAPGSGPQGVLSVFGLSEASPAPEGEEIAVLEKLGGYVARSLGRSRRTAPARGQSDGFMHWTVFQERIAEEIKRANRYGRSFAVTTIELDGLRDRATTAGPAWLEAARKALTQFVKSQVREVDIPAWVREGRAAILSPEATDTVSGLGRRLEKEWAESAVTAQVEGLAAMPLRVEEILFPRDTRNWDEFVDLVADRFGEGYTEAGAAG